MEETRSASSSREEAPGGGLRRGVRKTTSKDNRVVVRTETALHTEVMDNGYTAAPLRPGSCCEEDPHDDS